MMKFDFEPLPNPQSKSDFDKKFCAYSPRDPVLAVKKWRPFRFPLLIWSWICKNIQVLKNRFFIDFSLSGAIFPLILNTEQFWKKIWIPHPIFYRLLVLKTLQLSWVPSNRRNRRSMFFTSFGIFEKSRFEPWKSIGRVSGEINHIHETSTMGPTRNSHKMSNFKN